MWYKQLPTFTSKLPPIHISSSARDKDIPDSNLLCSCTLNSVGTLQSHAIFILESGSSLIAYDKEWWLQSCSKHLPKSECLIQLSRLLITLKQVHLSNSWYLEKPEVNTSCSFIFSLLMTAQRFVFQLFPASALNQIQSKGGISSKCHKAYKLLLKAHNRFFYFFLYTRSHSSRGGDFYRTRKITVKAESSAVDSSARFINTRFASHIFSVLVSRRKQVYTHEKVEVWKGEVLLGCFWKVCKWRAIE